jgi:hypothetical protein
MVLNWGIEALKWHLSVATVHPLGFGKSFKAVLTGVSFAISTPNRIGEYVGRMLYMPEGKRLKVIAITLINSMSQIWATLVFGTIGFLIFRAQLTEKWKFLKYWDSSIIVVLLISILFLTLFYFNVATIEKRIEKWLKGNAYLYLIEAIQAFGVQRLSMLLLLSVTRYLVFALQYILLFRLFEVHIPVTDLFWMMTVVFLMLAIIPSIALVEIGVRGEVSLQLLGLFTNNSLGIVLTSITVWLVNLIIPALAGSILILGLRMFKRRNRSSYRKKTYEIKI